MEPVHPLVAVGTLVGIGLLSFFVLPLIVRKMRKQDTLTKSGRSSSADAAKTSESGRKNRQDTKTS